MRTSSPGAITIGTTSLAFTRKDGASGLAANAITTVSTTGTLAGSVVGGTVIVNAAGATTQTLMAANTVNAGKRIELMNINAGIATISRGSTDTITVNGSTVTSLTLGAGDTLTLESNGSNGWYAVAGSAQLFYSPIGKQTIKAWANWVGSTGALNASYNVTSVTRNSAGNYTINFTNAMTDTNYMGAGMAGTGDGNTSSSAVREPNTGGTKTTTAFQIWTIGGASGTLNVTDFTRAGIAIFGN